MSLVNEENKIYKFKNNNNNNNLSKDHLSYNQTNRIEWIEKLLQTPLEDQRKYCLWHILCPYLINVKKFSYEESFSVLKDWLEKCNQVQKINFSIDSELRNRLKYVQQYLPISYSKLIEENKLVYNFVNKIHFI